MSSVRVRFAPSPTGYLHVGGLRTALYNYLYAKHMGGTCILRIEDTDRTRTVEGAAENLIAMLKWCGITFDEGPGMGGAFGPYVQSERLPLYAEHAKLLVASGHAYPCFCSSERLDTLRKQQQTQKLPPMYDRHCRVIAREDAAARIAAGEPHVIRLTVPLHDEIVFHDVIRGAVSVHGRLLDDQVLIKTDGFPTYHLANVVDDHLMQITDVIRGEEWLPSTPKHVLLYRAFGWDSPRFAHLPLLLNADKSKLSKRQGDVAVEDYKAKGFLPDALVNFVALLGWNPTADREIFSREELIALFDLVKVNKSGAVFDLTKLTWMNAQYVREELPVVVDTLHDLLTSLGIHVSREYVARVVHVMKERAETLNDFVDFGDYFWSRPTTFDAAYHAKHWTEQTPVYVREVLESFRNLASFTPEAMEERLRAIATAHDVKPGGLIHPMRLATTGKNIGPGLFDLLEVLGREEVCARIELYLASQESLMLHLVQNPLGERWKDHRAA